MVFRGSTGFLVNSNRISATIGTGEIVTAMARGRMLPDDILHQRAASIR
jgi:hypothetical protein